MNMKETITLTPQDREEYLWNQDALHFGHPLTPLFASYMIPAMTEGTRISMGRLKAPFRQFIGKVHDGYFYQAVVPAPGDPETLQREHQEALKDLFHDQHQRMMRIVEERLLPLHQELDTMAKGPISAPSAIAALHRIQEIYQVFWATHFEIVVPRMAAGFAFEEIFTKAFPNRPPTDAYLLLLGTMNRSLESDRALWNLAQEAKQMPSVYAAFSEDDMVGALHTSNEGVRFLHRLDALLQVYGWRTVHSHEFIHEAWVENPAYALSVIKTYLTEDFDFDQHWDQVVTTRIQRVNEAVGAIADPALREQFIAIHENALNAWPIDEDHHFYIDAMLPAKARQVMLRIGELLVNQHQLAGRDDLFFLYQDELINLLNHAGPADLPHLIHSRREQYQIQLTKTPVPQFGTPPDAEPDLLMVRVFGGGSPSLEGATREVRGFAASPGRYVGPVRIVHGPEEFFKVKPGDVLVCRTTAPSWTGLFATVGAVITETGGILSHAATVAREYGIPCVVGTRTATHVFSDGDRVCVDGAEGTATVDD